MAVAGGQLRSALHKDTASLHSVLPIFHFSTQNYVLDWTELSSVLDSHMSPKGQLFDTLFHDLHNKGGKEGLWGPSTLAFPLSDVGPQCLNFIHTVLNW